jgi:hypothetical protein
LAARTACESHPVKQFGLNTQESADIRAAGLESQALLPQLRQVTVRVSTYSGTAASQ